MTSEIKISQLTKKYAEGKLALGGVDLEISKSCIFALLGPNGAGKSTLIKIMTTLIEKDSGFISICGFDPSVEYHRLRHCIGTVSQDNELDPTETPENLLNFQCRLFGFDKRKAAERTDEMLKLFGLDNEKNNKSATLSGGNKKKLHCALALVHRPSVIFLDEPTVGMDPEARISFWNIIKTLNATEKITVLLTTQYLDEAEKFASDMAVIVNGTIQFNGKVHEFKNIVHPDSNVSLEYSYLKYIKSLTENN